MTQRPLFDGLAVAEDDEARIAAFKAARSQSPDAPSTIAAEVSQLRSLARDARSAGLSLEALLDRPEIAAHLIKGVGESTTYTTLLTRSRALQRFARFSLGDGEGREWIEKFRSRLPRRDSKGWHDGAVSLPGAKARTRPRTPTPGADALARILEVGIARSPLDGPLAGLVCFSGLELDEIAELRGRDIRWQDQQSGSAFAEVKVRRRGHLTTCYIMAGGTRALLGLATAIGLERDSLIFQSRDQGAHLSRGALRNRLRSICSGAGWPSVTRSQLTSAFVQWLREQGLDDHSIRLTLGRRRASTIDRLLRHVDSIAAQYTIDTALSELDSEAI